jgi:alpha-ketoglutarate-dependent taurine dioxygenase/4-hydroxybenzoate polyprenyltransferase
VNYTIEKLSPFGAIIRNNGGGDSIEQFSPEQLFAWVSEHKLIVFKGYRTIPKQELALFAQKLGKPLQWVFGAINDLKVKVNTENYIFTDHKVPFHWDGAFVGKIPHIILFQCIVAPKKEDLGGTTFVDTHKVLEQASAEKIKEWKKITITYRTKKIVHYGGQLTQQLIAKHEVEDKPVLRYAEPVDDLNPVSLEIKGLENKAPATFISEMEEVLYRADNLYTHRWEANDIVLADNHTLLHGREAFKNPNERYIQRINILHRPKGFSLLRFLDNCLTIRRKEFFVAELPIFLIPLLMCISSWSDFAQPMLYIGLAAIIMLFNIGDMINCYADYELDSIYKSHLSNAVYELGKKNVKAQIIGSGILAIILTVIVALSTERNYLIPLTIVGTFIGLQYSVKPFKFKSQGLLQLLCLWGIIFFGPMLYTAIITNGFPGFLPLFVFSFYGFHQMGIIMLNTAEDYTEDKANGLNTIIIRLGLHRAMNFAFFLVIISGLCMLAGMTLIMFKENAPWYLYLSNVIFIAGWIKIVLEYKVIIDKINKQDEDEAILTIKKNGMKVPEWLKLGAYSFLTVIAVYFVWNLYN